MRYLGSKDKLLPLIHSFLYDKGLLKPYIKFFDAFCGTGAVANSLKTYFKVIINDSMQWSVVYATGRIFGKSLELQNLGFDPFQYFQEHKEINKGFFYNNYAPTSSERMYFTPENAGRIDFIRMTLEKWKKMNLIDSKEYAYLIFCLIESVSKVANTAGVYGAFLKHWDPRAQKKLEFVPVSENFFEEVEPDYPLEIYNSKIEDIIDKIECDILYLDPPYTQNQYGTQYHLLETLVLNDNPPISKITGSRPVTPLRSLWSTDIHAHILLDRVVADTQAKHIIMSYNNDGFMSKDYIEAIFKRYGKSETYEGMDIDYKKYNNFKSRGRDGHHEFLFYVEKKPTSDIIFESPLNYPGSKAKMMPIIKKLLPSKINTFVDVFGGGFNVGINVDAETVIYNDINPYVVNLIQSFYSINPYDYLQQIRKLISQYDLSPNNKEGYLKLRDKYNSLPLQERKPILLYTLILFGFQQQIRFNSSHDFNMPPGSRYFNDNLMAKFISFARRIRAIKPTFLNHSFTELEDLIKDDVFFYLDPPYRETTATYNDGKRGFEGWNINHEAAVCDFMDRINKAGGKFMFSYLLQQGEFYNNEVADWANRNKYIIHPVTPTQGRYNNRKEVLITNYNI